MKKHYERALLMGMDGLNAITWVFINTFLVAYLFRAADLDVSLVSFYFMILYGTVLVLAVVTGPMIKAGYRLSLYRSGIALTFLALSWIMFAGQNIVYHIEVCGILFGSAMALKTFSRKWMMQDANSKQNKVRYPMLFDTLNNVVKMMAPFILGYFLTSESMGRMILLLLCLMAIEWCFSMAIKQSVIVPKGWFNLKTYIKKTRSDKLIKHIYITEFFNGIALNGVLNVIVMLHTICLFETDFNLGFILSVFNGVFILTQMMLAKWCTYKRLSHFIGFGILIFMAMTCLFTMLPNKATLIIYNLCFVGMAGILMITGDVGPFKATKVRNLSGSIKSEYFAVRQLFLNLGRVFSFALLTIGVTVCGNEILRYFLFVLSGLMCIMGVVAYVMHVRTEDYDPTELVVVK